MKKNIVNRIASLFASTNNSGRTNIYNLKDPLNELSWLRELKTKLDKDKACREVSIFQAKYKKRSVFYTSITDSRCDLLNEINLINSDGKKIKTFNFINIDEFDGHVTDIRKVYSSCLIK